MLVIIHSPIRPLFVTLIRFIYLRFIRNIDMSTQREYTIC